MPMIGADIDDLNNVQARYTVWSEESILSGTTVVTTCRNAVDAILAETDRAEQQCIDAINRMADASRLAVGELTAAEYVGQNADVAREAGSDMDTKCQQAIADMQEHFANFRTSITTLGTSLDETATAYDGYAKAAGESGQGMAQGLTNQAQAIQDAMSGMSYG